MRAVIIILVLSSLFCFKTQAQGYFAFYELRDLVQQSQSMQPAFIPDNAVSVSFPALNVGSSLQSGFRLQDLLSKNTDGLFVIDFDVLQDATNEMNYFNSSATAHLFALNIKMKKGGLSFFTNTRANFDLAYGEELIEFLANGNANYIGNTIDFSDTRLLMNAYHEYGVGYTHQFLADRLVVGARVKLIQGLFHGSTNEGFKGSLTTDENDFAWTMNVTNGQFNTAGLDYLFNAEDYDENELTNYLLSNQNSSLGFDIGAKYQLLPNLKIEAAVNDIGKMRWNEQVRNYQVEDGSVVYEGVDLKNLADAENIFRDSLFAQFNGTETENAFESRLGARYYFTVTGNVAPNDRFSLTYFKNTAFSDAPANIALSFNHRFENFVVGAVGSYRGRNNEVNLGASLASNIGPVQLYVALDNILIMNRPERYSKGDFRFGLNLMFGYKKYRKDDIVDLDAL